MFSMIYMYVWFDCVIMTETSYLQAATLLEEEEGREEEDSPIEAVPDMPGMLSLFPITGEILHM